MGRPNEAIRSLKRRISKIIDELVEENEAFKEVDKGALMDSLAELTENFSDRELTGVSDGELRSRLRDILLFEALSGLLTGLSSEQIEAFDEAAKRREFF